MRRPGARGPFARRRLRVFVTVPWAKSLAAALAGGAVLFQAQSLAGCTKLRHAFFTRQGGISTGVYASLNGGLGSRDNPEHVHENRRRMAAQLGVRELFTPYQIHSSKVLVLDRAWHGDE